MCHRNGSLRAPLLAIELSIALSLANVGWAVDKQPTLGFPLPTITPQEIKQTNPTFLVRADVNRALRSYGEGDSLSITVACEEDAYLYVLYKQADGQVFQIFPNANRANNRVRARQAVQIPGPEDLFTWVVSAPFGKEDVKVLASREPLEGLSDPATRQKFFNPISTSNLKGIQLELGKADRTWAEDNVEINTYQVADQDQRAGARRFGLFVGIGQYEHMARVGTTDGGKEVTVYEPGHRDARTMAGIMQEVGRLNDVRILTNQDATRANVEDAVTKWLPSVSRPGDTVFFYFSGMALPIAKVAGTNVEGTILPLHDFLTPSKYAELSKQKQEGKLNKMFAMQLARAEQLVQAAGNADQGSVAVVKEWGVSDDRFAHWLQTLAGRQVTILLDAPYSAAFAPAGNVATSDPMTGGVARLSSLGQRDIALLGASGDSVFSIQRNPEGMSLMTECLINTIKAAPATLSLEEAHREVAKRTEERLRSINQSQQSAGKQTVVYRPYLVNTCSRPVLLKP